MDLSDVFYRYIVKNVKRNAENSVKIDRFRESGMEPSWPSAVICQFGKLIVFISVFS